ncbi:hypothetical protein ACOSQ4_014833 [Xanthoceras sorbifolium]
MDKDVVKKLKEGIFDLYDKEVFEDKTLDLQGIFTCSSLYRFPIYEADFGWGRPMWVAFGDLSTRNNIFFNRHQKWKWCRSMDSLNRRRYGQI